MGHRLQRMTEALARELSFPRSPEPSVRIWLEGGRGGAAVSLQCESVAPYSVSEAATFADRHGFPVLFELLGVRN